MTISRLEIIIKIFDKDTTMSSTELQREYECTARELNSYVDSLLVNLMSSEPSKETTINVPTEINNEENQK